MMKASLCILACAQVGAIDRLIGSVRQLHSSLEVEVVIGDNSPQQDQRVEIRGMSDVWFPVIDRELWFEGFGVCKQKIANAANNDWCIIADPDEVWSPVHVRLSGSVQRTVMDDKGEERSHGRVFDRRGYRLMGMIHEELYRREDRRNWGFEANPVKPFARIEHKPLAASYWYRRRKQALYESLLWRIWKDPSISPGTASYWVRFWAERMEQEPGFKPMTFEQWREL